MSIVLCVAAVCSGAFPRTVNAKPREILNVSYDPTRELFDEINDRFVEQWRSRTGETVSVVQSHGGSGKQARAVIEGLEADVVSLALAFDIDKIATAGLLPADWQNRLPHNSSPFTSAIVFLVRKGNPKGIRDWPDLARPGVKVVTPNPKTSGGARWGYLAAWGFAEHAFRDEGRVRAFIQALLANVPVFDTGARGATTTFVQRGIGDVLITWENEAIFVTKTVGKDRVEIVNPSVSVLTEPPVAVVRKNVVEHGTEDVADAYLRYLFEPEAQDIIARHHFRPRDTAAFERARAEFAPMKLLGIDADFGGWKAAQREHFDEGGTFDQLYQAK